MLQLATSDQWRQLISKYTEHQNLIDETWDEIVEQYSNKNRYYHNLIHIESLLNQANQYKDKINDIEVVQFAIWYHDIIYKVTSKNNEIKSAQLMRSRLEKTRLELHRIEQCEEMIVCTKLHQLSNEHSDTSYLLDFDLSILGQSEEGYQAYSQAIRSEFKIYPTIMYNRGRKKALQNFLMRKRIYHTEEYFELYEAIARHNLEREIKNLG